jgi:hypothetical protein
VKFSGNSEHLGRVSAPGRPRLFLIQILLRAGDRVVVPFADVGPLKFPAGLPDEKVLFLSGILPTAYKMRP